MRTDSVLQGIDKASKQDYIKVPTYEISLEGRKGKEVAEKLISPIFGALVGVFVVIASVFFIPAVRELLMGFWFITISGVIFFLLGVVLIFLTVKGRVGGMPKKFLILTGASSAGLSVSVFYTITFTVYLFTSLVKAFGTELLWETSASLSWLSLSVS